MQLEDVERERRAVEEQDQDTIELLRANRSEILAMYDEELGKLHTRQAELEDTIRKLKTQREEILEAAR